MDFFYKKESQSIVPKKEIEIKSSLSQKDQTTTLGVDYSESLATIKLFLAELDRLLQVHRDYILFHEMFNVLFLIENNKKSDNIFTHFSNIMLDLKSILTDLYRENSVYSDVFLTLFKTGLVMMVRDKFIFHHFFDSMTIEEAKFFLNKTLPENKTIFGHDAPKKSIADILLRGAKEFHQLELVEALISKGVCQNNGTVFQEIRMQLPERSRLQHYLFKEKGVVSEMMGLFLQELSQSLDSYKNRLFSLKSASSDKALAVLENNLSDRPISFAKIIINITRFMAEKTRMKKPGELFKRLFSLWQAGLWILSQHESELKLFFQISDNSGQSVLRCRLWSEFFWEKQAFIDMTIGKYFMRVASETHNLALQLLLTSRGVRVEENTLFLSLKESLCSESLLREYFNAKVPENASISSESSSFCCVTAFDGVRDSLDFKQEEVSEMTHSSSSSWFFDDVSVENAALETVLETYAR